MFRDFLANRGCGGWAAARRLRWLCRWTNLTDAQFIALRSRNETTTFQLNITVTDAHDAAASAWAVTEIIIDTGNDATVVANAYDGGHAPSFSTDAFYWERLEADTEVLLENSNSFIPPRVEVIITDRDISTTAGDTYTYGLSVRRVNNRTAIEDLLVWSAGANETLKEQANPTFRRAIRFARDMTEADIGMYTVSWNITEERTAQRAPGTAAANGTFTMNIRQTPRVTIVDFTPSNSLIIAEGMDSASLPGGSEFSAEVRNRHGNITYALDYNRSLLGDVATLNHLSESWPRGVERTHLRTGSVRVTFAFTPTDSAVGDHSVWLLATTADGTTRREITVTVDNVNDNTTAAAGALTRQ